MAHILLQCITDNIHAQVQQHYQTTPSSQHSSSSSSSAPIQTGTNHAPHQLQQPDQQQQQQQPQVGNGGGGTSLSLTTTDATAAAPVVSSFGMFSQEGMSLLLSSASTHTNQSSDPSPSMVDMKDESGWTPLHWACRNAHFDVACALLRIGEFATGGPPQAKSLTTIASLGISASASASGDSSSTSASSTGIPGVKTDPPLRLMYIACSRLTEDHRNRRPVTLCPAGARTLRWIADDVLEDESNAIRSIGRMPDSEAAEAPSEMALHLLPMVGSEEFADVVLQLDDGSRIFAHKFVLCRFPYFRALLVGSFAAAAGDSDTTRLAERDLPDVSTSTAMHILHFMYTGLAPFGGNDASEISVGRMSASVAAAVSKLVPTPPIDAGDISSQTAPDAAAALDVVDILRAADRFGIIGLKHRCERLLCQDFVGWKRHRGLLGLFLSVSLEFKCARLGGHCCRVVRKNYATLGPVLRTLPAEAYAFIKENVKLS